MKPRPVPDEMTVAEAVELLNVSRHTVQKYMDSGLIRVRNVAPPTSVYRTWRLLAEDVIALRTTYGIIKKPSPKSTRQIVAQDDGEEYRFMRRKRTKNGHPKLDGRE